MNYSCRDCKYYDVDYEWDDLAEDEVEILTCKMGMTYLAMVPMFGLQGI